MPPKDGSAVSPAPVAGAARRRSKLTTRSAAADARGAPASVAADKAPPLASTAPSTERDAPHHALPSLDGLRGVLSVIIIVGHVLTYFVAHDRGDGGGAPAATPPTPLIAVVGLPFLAPVSLFVLLSGFTLTLTYDTPGGGPGGAPLPQPFSSWAAVRAFYYRRWARLAPMYYASLALSLPFLAYAPDKAAASLATAPLMMQSVVLMGNGWNAPLWTVSALALCYVAFPAQLRSLRRLSNRGLAAVAAGCYALSCALAAVWAARVPRRYLLVLHIFGPARLPQFVVGVCAALLQRRAPPARPARWMAAATTILVADTAACMAAVASLAPNPALHATWQFAAGWAALPAQAALLVGLAAPGGAGGVIHAALASRPAVTLGDWSYAAYCLHFPLLLLGGFAAAGGVGPAHLPLLGDGTGAGSGWFAYPPLAAPALVAAVLAAAAAAHAAVELPLGRLLRRAAGGGK
jgi:peptidoglycan/LPS O-acetylase OafA/YrhL